MRRSVKILVLWLSLFPLSLQASSYHALQCETEDPFSFLSGVEAGASFASSTSQVTESGAIEDDWGAARIGTSLWRNELFGSRSDLNQSHIAFVDSGFDQQAIRRASGNRFANRADISNEQHFHGTGVVNTAFAFNRNADLSFAWTFDDLYQPEEIRRRLSDIRNDPTRSKPKVVNISYAMGDSPKVLESLSALDQEEILVVASAGNYGDQSIHANNRHFNGILVGSISPWGIESDYSQTGREVDILAPADYYLGVNFNGQSESRAMGTSFSAPIVSGILSEAVGILGEDVPNDFLESLMKKTATKTINGIGMINRDKLLAVAHRIRSQRLGFDQAVLENPRLFDLQNEASRIHAEAKQALSASDTHRAIELTRLAFHLDQGNDLYRKNLVHLYGQQGLSGTANFYESLTPDESEQKAYLAKIAKSDEQAKGLQASAARLLARLAFEEDIQGLEVARLTDRRGQAVTRALEEFHNRPVTDYADQLADIHKQTDSKNAYDRNLAYGLIREILDESNQKINPRIDPDTFENQTDQKQVADLILVDGPEDVVTQAQKSLLERLAIQSKNIELALLASGAIARSYSPAQARSTLLAISAEAAPVVQSYIDELEDRIISDLEAHALLHLLESEKSTRALQELLGRSAEPQTGSQREAVRLIVFEQPRELQPLVTYYFLSRSASERKQVIGMIGDAVELWKFAEKDRKRQSLVDYFQSQIRWIESDELEALVRRILKELQDG